MLAETVQEWTAEWVEEGREKGREEGIRQGREQGIQQGREEGIEQGRREVCAQERALLRRQAARKFDAAAAERLAALVARVADPDRLAEVGDWIIECETASDLFVRVTGASFDRLVDLLRKHDDDDLTTAFREWATQILSLARSHAGPLQRLEDLHTMLAEGSGEWKAAWVEHGREQGIEQGIRQGREEGIEQGREEGIEQGILQGCVQERALLCRQAGRKFDAAAAERLAALIAEVADPYFLVEVGDWIIECETAADLFARLSNASVS